MSGLANGIRRENPVLVLSLGLCPALAVSYAVANALALAAVVLVTLVVTNLLVVALKPTLPHAWELPSYLVILGILVTVIELVFEAYMPHMAEALGIFLPLTAVNCLIVGRAFNVRPEGGASGAFVDAVGMALGFGAVLLLVAVVRELLGSGTLTLVSNDRFSAHLRIPLLQEGPATVLLTAVGGFLVLGYVQALANWLAGRTRRSESREEGL